MAPRRLLPALAGPLQSAATTHPVRDGFAPEDAIPSPASDPMLDSPAPDAGTLFSVLFVCRRNSCRSQFAEAFALAAGLKRTRVASAGLEPAARVDPLAAHVMRERGIDISGRSTRRFTPSAAPDAEVIVWIRSKEEEEDRARLPPGAVEWEVEDPIGWPPEVYRDVRDEVESLVQQFLAGATPGSTDPGRGPGENGRIALFSAGGTPAVRPGFPSESLLQALVQSA